MIKFWKMKVRNNVSTAIDTIVEVCTLLSAVLLPTLMAFAGSCGFLPTCVCLSAYLLIPAISQTISAARITKLDIEISCHES